MNGVQLLVLHQSKIAKEDGEPQKVSFKVDEKDYITEIYCIILKDIRRCVYNFPALFSA